MAGLTNQGWVTKTYNEIVNDQKIQAVNIFSDLLTDPNDAVDTSDDSTIGRLIGLLSPSLSDLWDALGEVYIAFDPTAATGVALDNIVSYIGLTRKKATYSTVMATFEMTTGTTIPQGSVVRNALTGSNWDVLNNVYARIDNANGINIEIPTGGVGTYTIEAIAVGDITTKYIISYTAIGNETVQDIIERLRQSAITHGVFETETFDDGLRLKIDSNDLYQNYSFSFSSNINTNISSIVRVNSQIRAQSTGFIVGNTGSITTIGTPILGWLGVTNKIPATTGSGIEQDEELRSRFNDTKYIIGTSTVDSIYSGILEVEGVKQARVYENDGDVIDSFGVLPHSFMCIVLGGSDSDIAKKIWEKKVIGVRSQGDLSIPILDSQGNEHHISFSRPISVPVFISMSIKTERNFTIANLNEIKSALTSYVNNLGIDGDIRYSRLFTPINSVPNFHMERLEIGTNKGNLKPTDLISDFNQVFTLSADDIEILLL